MRWLIYQFLYQVPEYNPAVVSGYAYVTVFTGSGIEPIVILQQVITQQVIIQKGILQ